MILSFSMDNGGFIHVFQFVTKSDDRDTALAELMVANKQVLKYAEYPGDKNIRRVVVVNDGRTEPSESEVQWLLVQSPRWDVEKPDTAIYDIYQADAINLLNKRGRYHRKPSYKPSQKETNHPWTPSNSTSI